MKTFLELTEGLDSTTVGKTSISLFQQENVTEIVWNGTSLFKKVKEVAEDGSVSEEMVIGGFNLPPDGSFPLVLKAFAESLLNKAKEFGVITLAEKEDNQFLLKLTDSTVIFKKNENTNFLYIIKD